MSHLSTSEQTQRAADQRFGADEGDRYAVELPGCPRVELPATSSDEAVTRYNALCGITGTTLAYRVERVEDPSPAP